MVKLGSMVYTYSIHYETNNGAWWNTIFYSPSEEMDRWRNKGYEAWLDGGYSKIMGFNIMIQGKRLTDRRAGYLTERSGVTVEEYESLRRRRRS